VYPRTGGIPTSNEREKVVRAFFNRMAEGGHIIDAFDEYLADECVWEKSGLPPPIKWRQRR
jgi:hypothetical protein